MPFHLITPRPAWLLAAALALASMAAGAAAGGALRPSFDLQVPAPPGVARVDGARELRYELRLANFSGEALAPARLQVLDADDGRTLADFDGDALRRRMAAPGADAGATTIAPGAFAVVYLEFALPADARPRVLEHRIHYHPAGGDGDGDGDGDGAQVVTGARTTIGSRPPPVLGPPLRDGPWVAVQSPDWPRGHRRAQYAIDGRARIPGRYAVDWIRVDARGRMSGGDPDRVADAYGYGAQVLAVADATVAAVRDDVPESATISGHPRHALADATGNYIALALGDGRFAFYEHLAPGSIRVRSGERVSRGQVIAALGFTGDSTGPHLHFHVADGPSPLASEGVAFAIDRFRVLGRYRDIATLGKAPWTPAEASWRTMEWPASNVVVDFGAR